MDRMGEYDCQSYRKIIITNFFFYFLVNNTVLYEVMVSNIIKFL